MSESSPEYEEELFGILTDDDLYLDCVLVRPPGIEDSQLQNIRVWVPKYPLTKSSVIGCARQEAKAFGLATRTAHLVFDLRGTGESESSFLNQDYELDLAGVRLWAEERFGATNLSFYGAPETEAEVRLVPLRPGVVLETYLFHAVGLEPPTLVYMSQYGNFSADDEATCVALANAGYNVFGMDPYRYLLHASAAERLTEEHLQADLHLFCQFMGGQPYVIARRIAAGLGLLWAAGTEEVAGVIAAGRAQAGLLPPHIFDDPSSPVYSLGRQIVRISPRPVALVSRPRKGLLGGVKEEPVALYRMAREPKRLAETNEVTTELLLELIGWLRESQPTRRA